MTLSGSPLPRLVALSALLYGCGYAVASVAPDLRYNLWTMLAAMLAAVVGFAPGMRTPRGGVRSRLAGGVLSLVIAGEMIALITA